MAPDKKGFTLIELLVVIAIIGTLASVVLASLNSARTSSRDAARMAQAKEIVKALELYYLDNNRYPSPTTVGGEAAGGCNDTGWDDNDCREFIPALTGSNVRSDNAAGTVYMPTVGTDPLGADGANNACGSYGFAYNTANSNSSYTLIVMLEEDSSDTNLVCGNSTQSPNISCSNNARFVCFSNGG